MLNYNVNTQYVFVFNKYVDMFYVINILVLVFIYVLYALLIPYVYNTIDFLI